MSYILTYTIYHILGNLNNLLQNNIFIKNIDEIKFLIITILNYS